MEFSQSVAWFLILLTFNLLECWIAKMTEEAIGPVTVYAVAGKKGSIPCNVHESSQRNSIALILWYKDNASTPMYSLDARQGNLDQARHASKESLMGRAFLNIFVDPAALELDPIRLTDQGLYKCRADYRNQRTRYSTVSLKVLVEPEKPIIKDRSGEILQSLVGPYNEGEQLLLICEVKGGNPLPVVTWWRETVLLDDTYHFVSSNIIWNELEIPALQRHDLMAVFTCQASNNNITAPLFSSVTVDMNFRPLLVSIDGENKAIAASRKVELTCRAAGSRPPAVVTWWLGMEQLNSIKDIVSVDGNITTSIVTFVPSRTDSGIYLACRAENSLIADSIIEQNWMLDVHYPPIVTLRVGGQLPHSPIEEGNDLHLDCEIESNPPVSKVIWKFGEKKLHTNRTAGIIVSNQSLIIQKIQRSNSGQYVCIATNSQGTQQSNIVIISVKYTPVCAQQDKVIYSGGKDQPVKVTCEVEADPPPLTFRWKVNSSVDTGQMVTFVNDGPRTLAAHVLTADAEFGTIECWGRNAVGEQITPCTYIVLPAGPPEKPRNCIITNQTETTFTVHCQQGYDGGVKQDFLLEVHNTATNTLQSSQSSDLATFVVRDVQPEEHFQVFVYSSNSIGRSKPVVLNATTLPSPSTLTHTDDDWESAFSPAYLILTILSVGLTASVIVAIVVVKMRQKVETDQDAANTRMDDKCQTPLRKDIDDEWKASAYAGDEKGPDIIPEVKESSL